MRTLYTYNDGDIFISLESMNHAGMFPLTTAVNGYFRTTLHDTIDGATVMIANNLKDHGMSMDTIGQEMETIISEFPESDLEIWYDEDLEIAYVLAPEYDDEDEE
jgi:hypothetical protein